MKGDGGVFSQKFGKEKSFDVAAGAKNAAGVMEIFRAG